MSDLTNASANQQNKKSLVQRSQKLASRLNETARALNFKTNSRRELYTMVGIRPRTRDRFFTFLLITSFFLFFAIPSIIGIVYFGFIASPKFQSETRFVLRSAIPAIGGERGQSEKGGPSQKIVQDTQVLTNYLVSPVIFQELKDKLDLQRIYSTDEIDYFSRLQPDATKEEKTEFWKDQITRKIAISSGIVTIKVSAFTASDAQDVLKAVIEVSEDRVNALNAGIWSELIRAANEDFEVSRKELADVRLRIESEQNRSGVFDIERLAESTAELIENVQLEILELESRRKVALSSVASGSSIIQNLSKQIEARRAQVNQMRSEIASIGSKGSTLAEYSAIFEKLQLERELAEQRFASATRELERTKFVSSLQLVYLDKFLEPTLPEESYAPRRILMIMLTILGTLAFWGAIAGIISSIRAKFD